MAMNFKGNMKTQRVKVIDGPLPPGLWQHPNMEPQFDARPEDSPVMHELMQLEPIFHRLEFGTTRKDFEKRMAPEFWEVGASGHRYSRQFVLDTLEKRYEKATEAVWEIGDFHCHQIATDNFLVTYTLIQGQRLTRRATIWRRAKEGWLVVYHQGTIVT